MERKWCSPCILAFPLLPLPPPSSADHEQIRLIFVGPRSAGNSFAMEVACTAPMSTSSKGPSPDIPLSCRFVDVFAFRIWEMDCGCASSLFLADWARSRSIWCLFQVPYTQIMEHVSNFRVSRMQQVLQGCLPQILHRPFRGRDNRQQETARLPLNS